LKTPRFLTARSTVIVLFIAISTALLLASSIPQRSSLGGKTPAWVGKLPETLQHLTNLLGLDNIVGTGWFAVLVALFWVSLVISTISQYSATKSVANRIPSPEVPPESIRIACSPSAFAGLAQAAGYREAGIADGVHRYVKNRVGFWGNFLLHVGLVTAVFFSLVYVLTQHRVLIRLAGQEIFKPTPETVQVQHGVLPVTQPLPYSVVLKDLRPSYWKNDRLESLSSELYFTDRPGGDPRRVDIAVSDKSSFGPYIVYQANVYGRHFDLEFMSELGEIYRERLFLPFPHQHDLAGYGETPVTGTDFLLKAKFYADAERKTMKLNGTPLTLRLYRGKELLGETTLLSASPGKLGPLTVRLVQTDWWTEVMLDGTRGIAGIFSGFALILAGVLCSYCLVPREIIVREMAEGISVQHVARRFAQFYREEFDEIIKKTSTTGDV